MGNGTAGIHHISAIVGNPQENVDFYAGVLGLRLIKRTINFDDPGTYHLYFGDHYGNPGTIITFFPWPNGRRGRVGGGQVGITSYAVPKGALPFWEKRLEKFQVTFVKMKRFGEEFLAFEDPHGLSLEIVEREEGEKNTWEFDGITAEQAIKGFAGAVLISANPEKTAELLENVLGLEKKGQEGDYQRFLSPSEVGNVIDLKLIPEGRGLMGAGTVHHIAWRAKDKNDQLNWKSQLDNLGYNVTPIKDRNYFTSIYFREHGSILFEIATDPPGFAIDEDPNNMGEKLMLPEWYEPEREKIEKHLLPIKVRTLKNEE